MKLSRLFLLLPALTAAVFSACNDGDTTIGESLVSDKVEVIEDSTFTIESRSVPNKEIMSRTITQLLGRLQANGYGRLNSEIVTQFMPAEKINFTNVNSVEVDSACLLLFTEPKSFTGDSLMPMGVTVYPLEKQLPSPIYSNFDPTGYYSTSRKLGSTIYTTTGLHSDSVASLKFRTISVRLDDEFARQLMKEYRDSASNIFYSPETFAQWFPGVYIANSFGDGRVTEIMETRINLYYKAHMTLETDSTPVDTTVRRISTCLAVTPEVITNNNLTYALAPDLMNRIESGEAIIAAPAGTDIELTLPLENILKSFRERGGKMSVLNTLSMSIPVEEIDTDYGITPPTTVLLVLKSKKDEFFAKNQLTDNISSFTATYNSTTKSYSFTNMRGYVAEMLEKETITPDDYVFVVTPVEIKTEQASSYSDPVVTAITPYITKPTLVKFNTADAKIKLIFSKQTINF